MLFIYKIMKYKCQILSKTKAVIEIIPETEVEKLLFNKMDKDNIDEDIFRYHFSKGLEVTDKSAVLLGINNFENFPTKANVSFGLAVGIGD